MRHYALARIKTYFTSGLNGFGNYTMVLSDVYEVADKVFLFGTSILYQDEKENLIHYDEPQLCFLIEKSSLLNILDITQVFDDNNVCVPTGSLYWDESSAGFLDYIKYAILTDLNRKIRYDENGFIHCENFIFRSCRFDANRFYLGTIGQLQSLRLEYNTINGMLKEETSFSIDVKCIFENIIQDWEKCILKHLVHYGGRVELYPKGYVEPADISAKGLIFLRGLKLDKYNGHYGCIKVLDLLNEEDRLALQKGGEIKVIENFTSYNTIKKFNTNELLARVMYMNGETKFPLELRAPQTGFYSYINQTTGTDEILLYYYESEHVCSGHKYEIAVSCNVQKDIYTQEIVLQWNQLHKTDLANISFNVRKGKAVLEFITEKPFVKKGDEVFLLMGKQTNIAVEEKWPWNFEYSIENTKILSYSVKDKTEKIVRNVADKSFVVTLYIEQSDMLYLCNWSLFSIRIVHANGCVTEFYNRYVGSDINASIYLFRLRSSIFADIIRNNCIGFFDSASVEQGDKVCDDVLVNNEVCYVYLMIDTTNGYYKIGISNKPEYREKTLQSEKPTIELLCAKKYPSRRIAESIESALHKTYVEKRIRGEWFVLNKSDVAELKMMLND